jgi:hypothetical protein
MAKPSGMLQAVCIFAILLGALGVCTGLWGIANVAAGGRIQEAVASVGGAGMRPEQAETQRQYYRDMHDITAPWNTINTPLFVLDIVVSVLMIVGAASVLRGRAGGRRLLARVFAFAILLELVQLVPTAAIQYDLAEIMPGYMEQSIVTAAPPGQQVPPQAQAMASTAGKAAAIVGLVIGVAMKLLEVGYYAYGYVFLRRPDVPPGPGLLVAEVVEN